MAHQAGAYPGFCSMKRLRVFLSPLDGMLVHRRVTPSIKFAGTHLYIWVERGTMRVKCLAQEHNTMSPARARTLSTRSGVERANHEATAPPTGECGSQVILCFLVFLFKLSNYIVQCFLHVLLGTSEHCSNLLQTHQVKRTEILTVPMFGYLILVSIDFCDFISLFSP